MRIREGKADVEVPDGVFYNPIQKLSRDIVVAIARVEGVKRYFEPFAATGIRTLRMFLEANVQEAVVNDRKKEHAEVARRILSGYNVRVYNEDAHRLIREMMREPFDMVDLDQFGLPWRYIDGAIMATRPGGILTFIIPYPHDLFGELPNKCLRIYGSKPVKAAFRYERGARIALLELSRRAAAFDRHIEPLLTFRHKYYLRFVVRVKRKAKDPKIWRVKHDDVNFELLEEPRSYMNLGGPARGGKIWDKGFIGKLISAAPSEDSKRFLSKIYKEADAPPLYYDIRAICSKLKTNVPKMKRLEELGLIRTHFYEYGIRAPSINDIIKALL